MSEQKIKRYDLESTGTMYEPWQEMVESDEGGWMYYSDHLSTLTRVESERDAEIAKWRKAEHDLSDAYLRLRAILKAFDTPTAPTADQVWGHTEACAKSIVAERDRYKAALEQIASGGKTATGALDLSDPRFTAIAALHPPASEEKKPSMLPKDSPHA